MSSESATPASWIDRVLAKIERAGNKLPDPAMLFLILMLTVWVLSAIFSTVSFSTIHPATGEPI